MSQHQLYGVNIINHQQLNSILLNLPLKPMLLKVNHLHMFNTTNMFHQPKHMYHTNQQLYHGILIMKNQLFLSTGMNHLLTPMFWNQNHLHSSNMLMKLNNRLAPLHKLNLKNHMLGMNPPQFHGLSTTNNLQLISTISNHQHKHL